MQGRKTETELQAVLRKLRGVFFFIFVFSFFINLLMLTAPLYMLQVYDRVLTSGSVDTLIALSVLTVGLFLIQALLDMVRQQILVRVGSRLDANIGQALLGSIVRDNLANKGVSAGLIYRDLEALKGFVSGRGLVAFFDAPWVPFFIAVIYFMHPILGMIAAGGAVILAILAILGEVLTGSPSSEAAGQSRVAANFADTSLRNAEAIEAMGMMPKIQERWFKHFNKAMYGQSVAGDRTAVVNGLATFWRTLLQSAILGAGAWLAITEVVTPGVMIAASILMGRALQPLVAVIGVWRQMKTTRQIYARLNTLLGAAQADRDVVSLPRPQGKLIVDKLMAAAPGQRKPHIQGVAFSLDPGEALGVIGPSASGKSSLARLLVGVWKPVSGHVRLDGADMAAWDAAERGQYVGYLPQDVELFDGSVADNIGRFQTLDSEKIVAAAQVAGAHDMILALPDGYETEIGSNGHVLSAGQRQRIGLARALYGDPALVVLDEPNANLDQEGEAALRSAIKRLKENKQTVVLIAHHSGIVRWCDSIMVMRDGRQELFGPRDEVIAKLTKPVSGGMAASGPVAVAAQK